MKGLFITLEGPDGSGKSTQIQKIASYLNERKVPYIQTREPGGTPISDKIRGIILDPEHSEMADMTEILLYAASRAQHVHEKIVPELSKGNIVLCDRFVDASIAYQGYGLNAGMDAVKTINHFATEGLQPNRSYLIDVSPEVGLERMKARYGDKELDRIEQKEAAYHLRVREGFQTLYKENQNRMVWIDGNQNPEDVFNEIKKDLDQLLANYYPI